MDTRAQPRCVAELMGLERQEQITREAMEGSRLLHAELQRCQAMPLRVPRELYLASKGLEGVAALLNWLDGEEWASALRVAEA